MEFTQSTRTEDSRVSAAHFVAITRIRCNPASDTLGLGTRLTASRTEVSRLPYLSLVPFVVPTPHIKSDDDGDIVVV